MQFTRRNLEFVEVNILIIESIWFELKDGRKALLRSPKEDKLIPSITVTIYFGADEWDEPLSLFDMMVFPCFCPYGQLTRESYF